MMFLYAKWDVLEKRETLAPRIHSLQPAAEPPRGSPRARSSADCAGSRAAGYCKEVRLTYPAASPGKHPGTWYRAWASPQGWQFPPGFRTKGTHQMMMRSKNVKLYFPPTSSADNNVTFSLYIAAMLRRLLLLRPHDLHPPTQTPLHHSSVIDQQNQYLKERSSELFSSFRAKSNAAFAVHSSVYVGMGDDHGSKRSSCLTNPSKAASMCMTRRMGLSPETFHALSHHEHLVRRCFAISRRWPSFTAPYFTPYSARWPPPYCLPLDHCNIYRIVGPSSINFSESALRRSCLGEEGLAKQQAGLPGKEGRVEEVDAQPPQLDCHDFSKPGRQKSEQRITKKGQLHRGRPQNGYGRSPLIALQDDTASDIKFKVGTVHSGKFRSRREGGKADKRSLSGRRYGVVVEGWVVKGEGGGGQPRDFQGAQPTRSPLPLLPSSLLGRPVSVSCASVEEGGGFPYQCRRLATISQKTRLLLSQVSICACVAVVQLIPSACDLERCGYRLFTDIRDGRGVVEFSATTSALSHHGRPTSRVSRENATTSLDGFDQGTSSGRHSYTSRDSCRSCGRAARLLASHQGEPGSLHGRVTPVIFENGKLYRIMSLVCGFSRRSPVSPALSFRCCSTLTSITLVDSQDLAVKRRPNLFTRSLERNVASAYSIVSLRDYTWTIGKLLPPPPNLFFTTFQLLVDRDVLARTSSLLLKFTSASVSLLTRWNYTEVVRSNAVTGWKRNGRRRFVMRSTRRYPAVDLKTLSPEAKQSLAGFLNTWEPHSDPELAVGGRSKSETLSALSHCVCGSGQVPETSLKAKQWNAPPPPPGANCLGVGSGPSDGNTSTTNFPAFWLSAPGNCHDGVVRRPGGYLPQRRTPTLYNTLHKQHYTETITTQTQISNTRRTPHGNDNNRRPLSVFGEDGGLLDRGVKLEQRRSVHDDKRILDEPTSSCNASCSQYVIHQAILHLSYLVILGATVTERLARSPPTNVNRVQSPAGSPGLSQVGIVPDDAVGRRVFSGISRFPAPSFRRRSIIISITLIGSQDLTIQSPPNLFISLHFNTGSGLRQAPSSRCRESAVTRCLSLIAPDPVFFNSCATPRTSPLTLERDRQTDLDLDYVIPGVEL
ncbi:hypothetical protein PR048_022789 [Dryococelus australis]|uniref:Uncharacterized protein n=1 Tax=Dryococelus australis TaxID=614101 RepID=A0ABQ9GSD2_9NEOP|nr:hypothetical protein PR048_022789 [Dryococelus australis]